MAKKPELTPREQLRVEVSRRMDGVNDEPVTNIQDKRHRDFVDKFVELDNGKAAAMAAGYAERSAAVNATKLLKTPLILEWIAHKTVLSNLEINLDKDWVKRRLMREADYDGPGSTQAARVQALNKLGIIVGLWEEGTPDEDEIAITINKRV